MTDSERIQQLEGKLRTWRRSALALVGAASLTATAGVAVAQRSITTFDSGNEPIPAIPAQSVLLELPTTKDTKLAAKDISFDFSRKSYELGGPTRLQWGSGYSLSVGSAYRIQLVPTDPTVKDGPVKVSLTTAPNSAQ